MGTQGKSDRPRWKRRNDRPNVPPQLRNEPELTGQVLRIVYASEDGQFQVARFRPKGEEDYVTIAGNLPGVAAGEPLHVHGEWKTHRQYGATFDVASYVPIMPNDSVMLREYLGSGLVKGIGPSYAKRIVDHFEEETLDILEHAPERLLEVKGLGRKRAQDISAAWVDHRQTHEVMMYLSRYGLSPALARRLYRHYGNDAAAVLRTNPYRVSMDVHGVGFFTADKIAENAGIARDSHDRLRAGFQHLLVRASDEGHTHVPEETLLTQAVELLGLEAQPVEAALSQELRREKEIRLCELPEGVRAIFMRSLYLSETGVARRILRIVDDARPVLAKGVAKRLQAFEERYRFGLAPLQRDAIHNIAQGGVCVVTGGPGTGKTTLVRALLYCLQDESLRIALCSPTGRAAQRLAETTGRDATTIHRLLKFNPQQGGFVQDASNPLEIDLLIVDESSMLDIPLAWQLLSAVPAGATVVFVGDVDQLPSVGPGNFLHDVIESGRARVTRLDVIFRQAESSAIIVNSHRVNAGKLPVQPEPGSGKSEPDFFFIDRDEPEGVRQALVELGANRIPRKFGFDPVSDVQVLTPMRRGELGTNELNRTLQETLNPGSGPSLQMGGMTLCAGDKIIQNRNNYDLDVFNGDVGVVQSVSPGSSTFRVLFGRRTVEYTYDEADQISLAYAVTIHKSQGSEYPAVIVLLHTQHYMMLRRNLLYTAITRGKKLVILIGSRRALGIAVRNATGGERLSALKEWLIRPPEATDLVGG